MCVYHKWPEQIFPIMKIFPTVVNVPLGGGGGLLLWLLAILM